MSQIQAAYYRDAAAIVTNHLTKLFFAGMSDGPGLEYVSRPLGEDHLPAQLASGHQPEDRPGQVTTVLVMPQTALRRMRPGGALLVQGTLPPAQVRRS